MFHEDGVRIHGGGADCVFMDDHESATGFVGLVLVYDFVGGRDGCIEVRVGEVEFSFVGQPTMHCSC